MQSSLFKASLLVLGVLASSAVQAAVTGRMLVTVLHEDGTPMPGVAVVMESGDAAAGTSGGSPAKAVMDQRDEQFVPALLVVRTGTTVEFPNSDHVMHHVYSFSPAKTFEIPLYQDQLPSPVRFDRPGLVVLGCNIHDRMIGHIVVVDSPHFGVTDERGTVRLPYRPGQASELLVWHPGMGGFEHAARRPVAAQIIEVRLPSARQSPANPKSGALSWDDY